MELQIIPVKLLEEFVKTVPKSLSHACNLLRDADLSTPNFSFYTSVASVFSSKIEGENIELDSFIKHKRDGIVFEPDYTKKTDDLYNAYIFAQTNSFTEINIKEAHKLLSSNLVSKAWQGQYRTQNMYVATAEGKIEYVAASPDIVRQEMEQLYNDIESLIKKKLSIEETFFFAAMIHLVFVKIHPFTDGNGRTARLIEKWFLSEKLGSKAWFIQSEKMYYVNHNLYYQNLRKLGLEYNELDYDKALPFLLMLPSCLLMF